MSLPVFFVVMAMVGEFRFTALGVPTQDVVRIWLVKEPNERGFGFSVPRVVSKTEHELYVQTNVSYLLWEGVGESISYCVGHARDHVNDDWVQFKMSEGVCNQ